MGIKYSPVETAGVANV